MIVRGNLPSDDALPTPRLTNKSNKIESARTLQVLPVQTLNLFSTDSRPFHRDESVRKDFARPSSILVRRHHPQVWDSGRASPAPSFSNKLSSWPLKLPEQFGVTLKPPLTPRTSYRTRQVRSKSQLARYSRRQSELLAKRFDPTERAAISDSLHVDKMQLEILKKKHVHQHFANDDWEDAKSNVAVVVDDDDDSVKIHHTPGSTPRESSVFQLDGPHLTLPSIDPLPARLSPDRSRRCVSRRRQYTFVLPTLDEHIDNEQNSEQTI